MTKSARKYLTFSIVLLSVAISARISQNYIDNVYQDVTYDRQLQRITSASYIDKITSFHKKIDALRMFINQNSQHKEDAEFFANWEDKTKLAGSMVDYLDGRRKDLPHMECGSRSGLMANILASQGYKVRSVDLYEEKGGKLFGHAALDVLNPETKKWESQDPEYDVYWINKKTKERVSVAEAATNLKDYVTCNKSKCNWNVVNREGITGAMLRDHTDFITTIDKPSKERITLYQKGLGDKVVSYNGKSGTYCQLIKKNCRDGFFESTPENVKKALD